MFYVYKLTVEGDEFPFYIGKGQGDRAWFHLKPKSSDISLKANKIRKAQREGKQVLIEPLKENLSEDDAFLWEVFFIAEYGRRDLGLGPLANLTDGGEGQSGAIVSAETRQKRSNTLKNKWSNETHFNKGRKHTDEHNMKIAQAGIGRKQSEETLYKRSKAMQNNINGHGKRDMVVCPYCGKYGGVNAMKRWHFDKCKNL